MVCLKCESSWLTLSSLSLLCWSSVVTAVVELADFKWDLLGTACFSMVALVTFQFVGFRGIGCWFGSVVACGINWFNVGCFFVFCSV